MSDTRKSFEGKIAQIFAFKKSKKYPEGMSKGERFTLRRLAAKYSLEGNILYYSSKGKKCKVIHTMKEAKDIFQRHHTGAIGGHQGIRKTLAAVSTRHYWPGMTIDISDWVSLCPDCQKVGKELNADTTFKSIEVAAPWKLVCMDLIGPLPETKKGNRYIFTATDYFSKWVEAIAIPNKAADTVTECIYDLMTRYGCPYRILSDCGSEFNNEVNEYFCKIYNIQRTFISPYHPQRNGLAGNTNRTIKTALRKYVDPSGTDWDCYLKGILFAMRTRIHMTTGFSPFKLLFGLEATFPEEFPEDFMVTRYTEVEDNGFKKYIVDKKATREAAATMALKFIKKAQERRRQRYTRRKLSKNGQITFQVGQLVMLLNARHKTRKGGSLQPIYRGPFKISSIVGKRVKLEDKNGKLMSTLYSISHLKPFKGIEKTSLHNIDIEREPAEDIPHPDEDAFLGTIPDVNDKIKKESQEHMSDKNGDKVQSCTSSVQGCPELSGIHSQVDKKDKDDFLLVEDKEWFKKVQSIQSCHDKGRLEAKVGVTKLFVGSFSTLEPRRWLSDEVIDAYLQCLLNKTSVKAQAISCVISTSILEGRTDNLGLCKRQYIQHDILLLPFNKSNHWILVIASIGRTELLVLDPLGRENAYEKGMLRNWMSFFHKDTGKSCNDWKTKVLEHEVQNVGHNCGPIILKFAETYLRNKDISKVEVNEKAMNKFRKQVAVVLLKESESVERYCIYCNFVTCKKKKQSMMVQCESCFRWAHVLCLPTGVREEQLSDERTSYNCNACS